MAPPPSSAALYIGGKGSSLSSYVVYSVSRAAATVRIDVSALEKLAAAKSNKQPSSPSQPPPSPTPQKPRLLTRSESRAALAVLLNKLLSAAGDTAAAVGPAIPTLLESTLSLPSGHETLDFASASAFFASLRNLAGDAAPADIAASNDELAVFDASAAASIAICAVLDCCASALVRLMDAVAALSCESARVDVAAFDLPVSGDGFSVKDETDVAGDMKMLLFGSKLVGSNNSAAFAEIPTVHGSFRAAVRALHGRVRVELNSLVKVNKKALGIGSDGKEKALVALALPLAMAVQSMCESSFARAKSCVESVMDEELRTKLAGNINMDKLKEKLDSIMRNAASGSDYVLVLRGVHGHLLMLRDFLGWEAAVALAAIETDDSIEKPPAGLMGGKPIGENVKSDKKSEKKKKKTLGKGTSVVMQLLRDRVMNRSQTSSVNVAVVNEWAQELCLFFDPADSGLESLIAKLKEIVESNEIRRLPKIPKGTRDFGKEQMAIRERAFSVITSVFKMHGAVALDTPVFELRETLMGKYGEDSKLIYDLADQGGELCSLRYDLTVPFARYVAMNNISALKRYQLAKVYRRDNPSKGRYREFYQCDFDIAGQYEPMEPDFEVIKVLTELLDQLDIGTYEIKLNHRKLLDGMLEICGVPPEKFRTVCSSIDKLDKQTFEQVKKEMVEEKGIAIETVEKIGTLVKIRGSPLEVLLELRKEGSQFLENSGPVSALHELEILFKALEKAKCLDKIAFDLSLARGLDYYTGVIYEAVFKGTTQVGSIAAGGRYDNLVGMFSGKQVPAVGVSLGIERVFTIMEQLEKDKNQMIRATETQVLVAILDKDLTLAAELASELWNAKIKAEFKLSKRVMNHITYAKQSGIPWMVLVGESELKNGVVKLKNIEAIQEEELPREKFVEELQRRINNA